MDIQKNMTYGKILIINLGGIGDVLLSTPAVRNLKSSYHQAKISLMVVPRVYGAVSDLPYVEQVIILDSCAKSFFKNLRALFLLRRKEFDLAINMRTVVSRKSGKKIKILLDIINPKIKVGRDTEGRGYFFDITIPEPDTGKKYEMEYDIEMVKALGVDVVDRGIDFHIDDGNIRRVDEILRNEGVCEGDILIGIHPGGKPAHRWALRNFSKVIGEIHKKIPCKFVVTGAKDEVHLVRKLIEITNTNAINFAGELNIKELGALIRRCDLYISNDTGSMHIAAILKTPLVAIFGPGDITRYDPRNISDEAVVLYKKVDCAPCERSKCESMKCLKAISPGEVVESTLKLLKKDNKL